MNLQIRDPRAQALARALAEKRNSSMTDAVIAALEAELARLESLQPLEDRVAAIADDLIRQSGPNGRTMKKDEIDAMWGHD